MQELLESIYNSSSITRKSFVYYHGKLESIDNPNVYEINKYIDIRFYNMIYGALALNGTKLGSLCEIDNETVKLLQSHGYFVAKYIYKDGYSKLSYISKIDPHLEGTKITSKKWGELLDYLTPGLGVIHNTSWHVIGIDITFRIIDTNTTTNKIIYQNTIKILDQIVHDKNQKQIDKYLDKYIKGIEKIKLPDQFKITKITKNIKYYPVPK
jgi:hypothetical protein